MIINIIIMANGAYNPPSSLHHGMLFIRLFRSFQQHAPIFSHLGNTYIIVAQF